MKFYFSFLLLLLTSVSLFSQSVNVTGNIVDGSGSEIPFASVVFTTNKDSINSSGTLANENGIFSLTLKKDDYVGAVSDLF